WDWERIWNPGKRFDEIASGTAQLGVLKGALEDLEPPAHKLNQTAAESIDSLGRQASATNALTGAAQALGSTQEWGLTVGEQSAAVQEEAAQQVFAGLQLQGAALEDFSMNVSECYGSATSLVSAFGSAAEVTAQQVMKHFAQQVEAAQNWSANRIELA